MARMADRTAKKCDYICATMASSRSAISRINKLCQTFVSLSRVYGYIIKEEILVHMGVSNQISGGSRSCLFLLNRRRCLGIVDNNGLCAKLLSVPKQASQFHPFEAKHSISSAGKVRRGTMFGNNGATRSNDMEIVRLRFSILVSIFYLVEYEINLD